MPTSEIGNIAPILYEAARLAPRSVLDLGAGSGKYGVLMREYLDIAHGRIVPRDQRAWIHGVEGFSTYINDLHYSVYSSLVIEDFSDIKNWKKYIGYDLVLMIDSLEHIGKDHGGALLHHLIDNNKNVIVSCPFGENYLEQGAVYGNEFERHRAHWTPEDFRALGGVELYRGVCVVSRISKR